MLANLCKLHINTRRILDTQYPGGNVTNFLIHLGCESELRSQLNKVLNFDPFDPANVHHPEVFSSPIAGKIAHAKYQFHAQLCSRLQNFKISLYNAVANFFLKLGRIDLDTLKSYELAPSYHYFTGSISDHAS